MTRPRLSRYCKRCSRRFKPTGKFNVICQVCIIKRRDERWKQINPINLSCYYKANGGFCVHRGNSDKHRRYKHISTKRCRKKFCPFRIVTTHKTKNERYING